MILRFGSTINSRFLFLLAIVSFLTFTSWMWAAGPPLPRQIAVPGLGVIMGEDKDEPTGHTPRQKSHPIDALIHRAKIEWHKLMAKETLDLEAAAKAYRLRRGRHPPPGFDKWWEFARDHDAIIVEDFFDQIYHDLGPFWGVPAKDMRHAANTFGFVISVRDGKTSQKSDGKDRPWMGLWEDLVGTIVNETYVPDLDMAINVMDEPRIVAPWEEISAYMQKESESRRLAPASQVTTEYAGLSELDKDPGQPFDAKFSGEGPYWEMARVGCPPTSPFRTTRFTADFEGPLPAPSRIPLNSYHGYVANWTLAKDPCIQPELQAGHGTFIGPISKSTTHRLFPMFGGSKLPMNNEILIPPAMYWSNNDFYTGGAFHGIPWAEKKDGLIWRGAATGGRNLPNSWHRFQRHRFINMLNGSAIQDAEKGGLKPPTFDLAGQKLYHLASLQNQGLGEWISSFSDVGFYDLLCEPRPPPPADPSTCPYSSHYFDLAKQIAMKDQYNYKILPDIDGNSFSGRYWGFLWSTSLPIKATIYNEWHDSRLIPWLHFVPMHNSYIDVYGILEYFLGNTKCKEEKKDEMDGAGSDEQKCVRGHDKQAEMIAMAGKEWAEKVLRRDDMRIYVYRLLLEYARLSDDKRDLMGFVKDLAPE